MSDNLAYGRRLDGLPNMVDGSTVEITIPFVGDNYFFHVQPTTFSMNPPYGEVRESSLLLKFTGVNQSAQKVRSEIDSSLSRIERNLEHLKGDASRFHSNLFEIASKAIISRREKILANQSLVSSLGFPLKERPGSTRTYTAPSVKRKIRPTPPVASSEPFVPEPILSDSDYDHILTVVQNMAQVMERSPSAFKEMDEEDIRTHFLVQLNGHFAGKATGETFNYEGKTDILIRENDRNIFIGECKFWGGPKKLTGTVDQLLGYSSWRDTKVAILLFNRNKELGKVVESAHENLSGHENCKRVVGQISETSFRYIFSNRDDRNREMVLTLMLFDVPR